MLPHNPHSRINPITRFALSGLVALVLPLLSVAQTAEQKGREIAARNDHSDRGFKNSQVNLTMLLRNAAGLQTERKLSLKTQEKVNDDSGDKSIIVFASPADIDGTALLSHARILDADDQWLYLPALKRTKRISSANKSGPFVGSEFAFEDFTAQELNKFTYEYLRSEPCGKQNCDVVVRYPRYEHSGYTRQISWVDQQDYQLRKVEFYDRRGDLLKTLTFDDYQKYNGKFWRAHKLIMVNHQTKKETELLFSKYEFDSGLTDTEFSQAALQRVH